jgi:octaprenyl-diphosphate synthase
VGGAAAYHRAFSSGRDVDLAAIYSLITDDMREVDAVIRARLRSEVVLVSQVAEYIIGAGGKRMRPALVRSVTAVATIMNWRR